MSLRRLSDLAMAAGLAGVLALVVIMGTTFVDLREGQAQMAQLLSINKRVDELSVRSDEMLLTGANSARIQAFRSDAEAIADQLATIDGSPATKQGVQDALEALTGAVTSPRARALMTASGDSDTPPATAGLSIEQRALASRVAERGVALDKALHRLIDQRRAAIAGRINQLVGGFSAAVLAFAGFGIATLIMIRRRLTGPVEALEATVDRVLAGDRDARAPVHGKDELGKLAAAFNAMLTQQQENEAEVARQKAALEERDAMLTESQRIANIGSWRYFPDIGQVYWSQQTFLILGFDPEHDNPDVEAFYQCVHADDREAVRASDQAALDGRAEHGIEYRVVQADGSLRHIREEGERRETPDGTGYFLAGTIQDITEHKALEAERYRLRERLSAILESVTDAVVSVDGNWRFGYINSEAARLLDLPSPNGGDRDLWHAVPALGRPTVATSLSRAMDERVTASVEDYFERLDRWLDIRAYPSREGLTLLIRDTTEHHRMLNRLMDQEARLSASHEELKKTLASRQALIDSLPANVALLDTDGNILDVNQQWCTYAAEGGNSDPDFSIGRNYIAICENATNGDTEGASEVAEGLREILRGERHVFGREYPCHSPTEQQWYRVVANRLSPAEQGRGPANMGAVVMHVDITERKRAEQALNRIAYEDALTGVASRQGFTEAVAQHIAEAGWQPHARVVMLDIHHQHDINETYGFEAGDTLLQTVAQRLRENTDDRAVIGRSGGDEFVVFLPAADDAAAEAACRAVAATFEERFPVGGYHLERRARFGYSQLGETPRDTERLLREAEMALFYAGASAGSEAWSVYTSELDERSRQRVQITDELQNALEHDEFELHFQPKVALDTGELMGAEALLRWWHPERGLQSPGLFVPIAEQSELIGPIGDWVLNDACRRLRAWQDEGLDIVRVSVNVSVVQFADGDFPDAVGNALYANGIDPSALTLEITESVFEQNAESLHRQLQELHAMGVRLSLDDFGTGYSSLLYLQQYPFDEIKIDKGFVMGLESEPYNARVVSSVIGIAEALGASVVAEGVESQSAADALIAMDCHVGQGFYYSMPLAGEDFSWLLETRSPLPLGRDTDDGSRTSLSMPEERS